MSWQIHKKNGENVYTHEPAFWVFRVVFVEQINI